MIVLVKLYKYWMANVRINGFFDELVLGKYPASSVWPTVSVWHSQSACANLVKVYIPATEYNKSHYNLNSVIYSHCWYVCVLYCQHFQPDRSLFYQQRAIQINSLADRSLWTVNLQSVCMLQQAPFCLHIQSGNSFLVGVGILCHREQVQEQHCMNFKWLVILGPLSLYLSSESRRI